MLADALAQYLVWKKWNRWLLVLGPRDEDKLYADAIRRSAKRFGGKIVEERPFNYETGASRRSDGGYEQIQQQIPTFTQSAPALRRAHRRRRRQSVRRLPSLSHLGRAPRRRHRRPRRQRAGTRRIELWGGTQFQNRFKRLADRYHAARSTTTPGSRARMIGEAASRTKSDDFKDRSRLHQVARVRTRRLQGRRPLRAQLERAGSPADPGRRRRSCSSPCRRSRASCIRSSELDTLGVDKPETQMQSLHAMTRTRGATACDTVQNFQGGDYLMRFKVGVAVAARRRSRLWPLPRPGAGLHRLRHQREGQHASPSSTRDKLEVIKTVKVGQRPRGIVLSKDGKWLIVCTSDDNIVQVYDAKTLRVREDAAVGARSRAARRCIPSGNPLYVANEDDNLVTVVDIKTGKVVTEIPVGVEPEGMGMSPDGKVLVNTSETTNMAHFIDTDDPQDRSTTCWSTAVRASPMFNRDGTQLWVTSEVGGTVTVIDPSRPQDHRTRSASTSRASAKEAIQPVGMRITKDGKTRLRRARPGKPRRGDRHRDAARSRSTCSSASACGSSPSRPTTSTCCHDQRRLQRRLGDRRCRAQGRSNRSGSGAIPGAWWSRRSDLASAPETLEKHVERRAWWRKRRREP